jgi:hypothetical protein
MLTDEILRIFLSSGHARMANWLSQQVESTLPDKRFAGLADLSSALFAPWAEIAQLTTEAP